MRNPKDPKDDDYDRLWGFKFTTFFTFDGNCGCCEYRQYVREAKFIIRFHMPGDVVDECFFDLDAVEPPGREDTDAHTGKPYGHRSDENNPGDEYSPSRADGCSYNSADSPGMPYLWAKEDFCVALKPVRKNATHISYYFRIQFEFNIVNFCKEPPETIWGAGWLKECESQKIKF